MSASSPKSNPNGWLTRFLEESSFLREFLWKYRKLASIGFGALILVDILEVVPPILLKNTVDAITSGASSRKLAQFAIAYLTVMSLQSIGRYLWRMYLIRASMQSGRDLRKRYA